ncbi:unnamed protein product [Caenorhabditis auriculariae]|uniref:Uncharacterized protein n=1 Tax=Caenorhabditis auriculariae TaxID=2777116 RepID=A0A8S1HMK8_9PELO|nr:unnamed protein product [Caenorhabditis auriculariae]
MNYGRPICQENTKGMIEICEKVPRTTIRSAEESRHGPVLPGLLTRTSDLICAPFDRILAWKFFRWVGGSRRFLWGSQTVE